MSNLDLSDFEQAALVMLRGSEYAIDPTPLRLPNGVLCVEYWHIEYQCYGVLLVTETLTTGSAMLTHAAMLERHLIERCQQHMDALLAQGIFEKEAREAVYGFPTRAALCVSYEGVDDEGYAAYQAAIGLFDEPLIVGIHDGTTWIFEEEEGEEELL